MAFQQWECPPVFNRFPKTFSVNIQLPSSIASSSHGDQNKNSSGGKKEIPKGLIWVPQRFYYWTNERFGIHINSSEAPPPPPTRHCGRASRSGCGIFSIPGWRSIISGEHNNNKGNWGLVIDPARDNKMSKKNGNATEANKRRISDEPNTIACKFIQCIYLFAESTSFPFANPRHPSCPIASYDHLS